MEESFFKNNSMMGFERFLPRLFLRGRKDMSHFSMEVLEDAEGISKPVEPSYVFDTIENHNSNER